MGFWEVSLGDLIAGAIVPIGLWMGQSHAARLTAAVGLQKDFFDDDMAGVRSGAQNYIRGCLPDENPTLDSGAGLSDSDKSQRENVYKLTRFFTRLNALLKTRLISERAAWEMFGPHFGYWWSYTFEHQQARHDWTTGPDILELFQRFNKYAGRRLVLPWRWGHAADQWSEWLETGSRQLEQDLADRGLTFETRKQSADQRS